MKPLFGLFFLLFITLTTIAQDVNPIYGLALCETDRPNIQQSTGFPEAAGKDDVASFKEFLTRFEKGFNGFINGDATLWKQHISRSKEVSSMGGFGAYEKGWQQVGLRYNWASARFKPSGAKAEIEYLSIAVSGELAYTASVERSKVHYADTDKIEPMALRATHVFKKENGEWKLLHRHADYLIEKATPGSAKQK